MTKNNYTADDMNNKQNIVCALHAFEQKSLPEAGVDLFTVLGYDTNLRASLEQQSYKDFENLYIDNSPNGSRFNKEKALVNDWSSVNILFQLTDESFSGMPTLFDSSVDPNVFKSYICLSLELKNSSYSKTQIANITREVNKIFAMPIVMIVKYGINVTIAIINRRVNKRDNDRDVLEKVTLIKDIAYKNPHRAHVEILFDLSLPQLRASQKYEINNFTSLHKAWSEVLDIQALNKRFYTELSNWYFWAIKTVEYPGYEMEAEQNSLFTKADKVREHNAKNLIRLLTRLLFVWFIKEKGLIPEELFDKNKIQQIIKKFEPEYKKNRDRSADSVSVYYKAILQNLFFASLNAEQGKRAFRIDGQNQNATNLMRYKRFHNDPDAFVKMIEAKVPFMNGGLFDCLDHQDDVLKGPRGGAIVKYEDGFSDRLDNKLFVPDYIFFGKEVKVDLSLEYDDKKKKDVVTNGIINILQKYKFTIAENTPIEEDIALDPELLGRVFENLLASYNPETKTNARKQTGSFYTPRPIVEYMVDESLKAYLKTKIIDDGNCNAEFEKSLNQKLDALIAYNDKEPELSENDRKKILKFLDECRILDPACGSGAFPMGILQKMVYVIHKLDPNNYNWKLLQVEKITSNKDLSAKEKTELIAEITSTFTDNELDYARKLYLIENCIHGIDIQPVATQISRLRFFISLIVDQTVDSSKYNFGIRPLPNLENRFVTANSLIGLNNERTNLSDEIIEPLLVKLAKVRHQIFNIKTPKRKFELKLEDKKIRAELEQKLMELGFGRENARLLSTWDPYDKNKSADFFDAEWMFGIKDGFDIVMGNPPYIRHEKLGKEYKELLCEIYPNVGNGTADIYVYFFGLSLKLAKKNGVISFITLNKWLKTKYGKELRRTFTEDASVDFIIDFFELPVFNAATDAAISQIYNFKSTLETRYFPVKTLDNLDLMKITSGPYQKTIKNDSEWQFVEGLQEQILSKISDESISLREFVSDKIYSGIKTGLNKAFVIKDENVAKKLLNSESAPIVKHYAQSTDIQQWMLKNDSNYFLATGYDINVKSKYPTAFKYLNEFKKELEQRGDKGCNWYNLRACAYYDDFSKPKLIYIHTAKNHQFYYDTTGHYINNSCYMIITNSKFLFCFLNSNLFKYYKKLKFVAYGDGQNEGRCKLDYNKMVTIPIRRGVEEKPFAEIVDKILNGKKMGKDTANDEKEINKMIYNLYNLTPDEIATVESNT
jgi:hypothetical protein